jgi:hypothetical protein
MVCPLTIVTSPDFLSSRPIVQVTVGSWHSTLRRTVLYDMPLHRSNNLTTSLASCRMKFHMASFALWDAT